MLNNYSPRTKILAGATILSATGALASLVYDKVSAEKLTADAAERARELAESDVANAVGFLATAVTDSVNDAVETIE